MASDAHEKNARLSPEFELALACCKSNFRRVATDGAANLDAVDWQEFIRTARFHRIEGLVWHTLAQWQEGIPDVVTRTLSGEAAKIAARNLSTAAECRDLSAEFETAGVPLLFLKGLTLGALAYGAAQLKSAIDIDLLVDPADLTKAAGLLSERGYQCLIPRDASTLRRWHETSKESVWAQGLFQLDLHTRTADNRHLIPTIDVHSPRQAVDIGSGVSLETLADEQLFAYLAVHGASSAWFRLKWIADFAGFVHGRGADEIERLYKLSQELGGGRAAGQALLLADQLFGTLCSAPALRERIAGDRSTRLLGRAALRMVARGKGEPTERRFGTLPIHWTQLLLLPAPGYKLSEINRQAKGFAARLI